MEEQTRLDKDYVEAFNQGYQLSKELNLKPEILKGLSAGNNRIQAMREGMQQYQIDKELEKSKIQDKDNIHSLDINTIDNDYIDLETDIKEKDKGVDLDY